MLLALILYTSTLLPLMQASVAGVPKAPKKTPPLCTVSGRVVTAADAIPLKSARVVLISEQKQDSATTRAFAATSDGEGRFTIKDVPAGRYQFFASHTGYVNQPYQSNGTEKGALLSLRAGQQIKDVLFRMIPAAVITGRITDEDGEPMESIQVVALQRPTEEQLEDNSWLQGGQLTPADGVQTDDRGEFRLFGLKPGEYFVRAEGELSQNNFGFLSNDLEARLLLGSQYAPVYYPGVTQLSQAETVMASPGAEVEANFTLRRTRMVEISGKVIGPDGKPPTNAYVTIIEPKSLDFNFNHGTSPDKNGDFKLKGIPPGSYVLIAEQQRDFEGSGEYHAQQNIEVGEDNMDSVTLVLGRGTKISGQVMLNRGSNQAERMSVNFFSRDADLFGGSARVKKDGSFEMLDVADGTYALDVDGLEEGYYVQSARAGRDDILTNGLQVDKEKGVGAIQIVIGKATARLEGLVSEDGAPLVGARVRITPVPETPYNRVSAHSTTTDQSGRFIFAAIGPGKYKIVAKSLLQNGGTSVSSEPQGFTVSDNENKEIDLTVPSANAQ
jgi:Carboxypeptidase regulatory-like domain